MVGGPISVDKGWESNNLHVILGLSFFLRSSLHSTHLFSAHLHFPTTYILFYHLPKPSKVYLIMHDVLYVRRLPIVVSLACNNKVKKEYKLEVRGCIPLLLLVMRATSCVLHPACCVLRAACCVLRAASLRHCVLRHCITLSCACVMRVLRSKKIRPLFGLEN